MSGGRAQLSDQLIEGAQAVLEPYGGKPLRAIPAQLGLHPILTLAFLFHAWSKPLTIFALPEEVLLVRRKWSSSVATELIGRCDRGIAVGWRQGLLYGRLELCGQSIWVHRRDYDDVRRFLR